jgi:hypothetical protein
VTSDGVVAPGFGAETGLIAMEEYAQEAGGRLEIDLSLHKGRPSSDVVDVGGGLAAEGTLALSVAGGLQPRWGNMFQIIRYAGRAGRFSDVEGWDATESLALAPIYQPKALVISTELRGDADHNRVVELSDIVVAISHWQATGEDATWANGDVYIDGVVDLSDVVEMIGHWQNACSSGAAFSRPAGAAVPEPGTLGLTLAGVCLYLVQRRSERIARRTVRRRR